MAPKIATNTDIDRAELLRFLAERHRAILVTRRAKVANLRRRPDADVLFFADDRDGPWVQVSGTVEVLDLPEALEPLVDHYRSIAGEHPDWDEYRQAMGRQGKRLARMTIGRWGPLATGGFPPGVVGV